ncbi:hypothetical protein TrLO_g7249 [Triparma laevis f. longispina]|uniref:Uncharacterized protein n=1 Tax=Triparma laevis f. longispina TaxID=1714387 RepID=A0A9W7CEF8_9STRA|nr:hypothetical protein TrLO_g7249 [Triparma laevis f. longispina]
MSDMPITALPNEEPSEGPSPLPPDALLHVKSSKKGIPPLPNLLMFQTSIPPKTSQPNPLTSAPNLELRPEPEETTNDNSDHTPSSEMTTQSPPPTNTHNSHSTTTPTHVTECHIIYSILMACISSSMLVLRANYAISGNEKISHFW